MFLIITDESFQVYAIYFLSNLIVLDPIRTQLNINTDMWNILLISIPVFIYTKFAEGQDNGKQIGTICHYTCLIV